MQREKSNSCIVLLNRLEADGRLSSYPIAFQLSTRSGVCHGSHEKAPGHIPSPKQNAVEYGCLCYDHCGYCRRYYYCSHKPTALCACYILGMQLNLIYSILLNLSECPRHCYYY